MKLRKLQLMNFRNYGEVSLEFPSRINVLVGNNGSGKTNLLDAIYWLSYTKGAFLSQDNLHLKFGESQFVVKGTFEIPERGTSEVSCGFTVNTRKAILEDGIPYQKLSDHIGKYPVVFMDPSDTEIVSGTGEVRRRFFDGLISQIDHSYLDNLIQYTHTLKQRNGLLRMFQETGVSDLDALASYDHVLVNKGEVLYRKRREFLDTFLPVFKAYFTYLTQSQETPSLTYESDLNTEAFHPGLTRSRSRDVALGRTTFGPHRDDFEFTIDSNSLRKFGSQGQVKSYVIALKLAQWKCIWESKGFKPVMLMDDIFDKLDDHRIGQLLNLIREEFGQLFLTDARPERSRELLETIGIQGSVFVVSDGKIKVEYVGI